MQLFFDRTRLSRPRADVWGSYDGFVWEEGRGALELRWESAETDPATVAGWLVAALCLPPPAHAVNAVSWSCAFVLCRGTRCAASLRSSARR